MAAWQEKLFVRQSLARASEGGDESIEKIETILRGLDGDILEIGPGGGNITPYLKKSIHYTALEPNVYFHDALRKALGQNGIGDAKVVAGLAASLPFPDRSFDAVIAVRSLCSVGDTATALAEIKRVLKPGGRLIFSEHVGAPKGSLLRLLQIMYRPFDRLFSCGCDLVKDTEFFIRAAGFSALDIQHFNHSRHFLFKPRIFGVAKR